MISDSLCANSHVMNQLAVPVKSDKHGGPSWLLELLHVSNMASARLPIECPRQSAEGTANSVPYRSVLSSVAAGVFSMDDSLRHYPVAMFGFSHELEKLIRVFSNDLHLTFYEAVILYNNVAGLKYDNIEINNGIDKFEIKFNTFLNNICQIDENWKNASISKKASHIDRLKICAPSSNDNPRVVAWKKYLFDNKDKLDPIIRLNALLKNFSSEGDKDTFDQFIIKNTHACVNNKNLAQNIIYLIQDLECNTSADIKKALNAYKTQNGESFFSESEYRDLADLYFNHFFRNTSKLGMEFFARRGYDIAFAWNAGNNAEFDLKEVTDKIWKRGQRRNQLREPITFSELRSLVRNKRGFFNDDNTFKVFITNDTVRIAKSLTSAQWVKIDISVTESVDNAQ